jgi:hypothetical protein
MLGVLLLTAAGVPAVAQDESAAIREALEASLRTYATLNETTLYTYGGVEVTADGSGYAITIADLRVAPEESGYLEVGDVRFQLTPEGSDFYRVSDLVLADSIPYRSSDGGEDGVLSLPSQQFTGRWSRPLGFLVDVDYSYRNVQARDGTGQPVVEIGEIASTTTSTETGNDRWDSITSFNVGDVRVSGDGETLTVARLEGSGSGRGIDMALAAGLLGRLWTLAGSLADEAPPPEFFQVLTDVYRAYAAFDGVYKVSDIRFLDAAGMETFSLPELTAELRGDGFDRDAGNLDMVVNLKDLRAVDDGTVSIGGIEIRSVTRGFRASEYARLLEQMQHLSAGPDQPPDAELFQVMGAMLSISSGGEFAVSARNISYAGFDGTELFRLADGAFAAQSEGFDQDLARVGITLGHGGLSANIDDPIVEEFVPRESHIGISLENLPVRELLSQGAATFAEAATLPPEQQEFAAMMFMGVAQQLLAQANSQVKLANWQLRSAAAAIDLDGVIAASMESMIGAVANLQLDIAGLDRIIETARVMSTPDDQEMLAGLEVLRGFSNRETAVDGTVVDRYAINFTPEGQFLINGKEFSFMGPMGDMPPGGFDEPMPED